MNIDLNIRNMAVMICDPDGEPEEKISSGMLRLQTEMRERWGKTVSLGIGRITGDSEAVTMAQLINNSELDIEKSLTELSQRYNDGLYEQAKIDTEKQQNRMLRSDFRSR